MNIIAELEAAQAAKLLAGRTIPAFAPGDTVIVNVKVKEGDRTRLQAYEGVCIARSGSGINESFTVRKISYGEGVERVFPVYAPAIDSVKLVRRGRPKLCAHVALRFLPSAFVALAPKPPVSEFDSCRLLNPKAPPSAVESGSSRLRVNTVLS